MERYEREAPGESVLHELLGGGGGGEGLLQGVRGVRQVERGRGGAEAGDGDWLLSPRQGTSLGLVSRDQPREGGPQKFWEIFRRLGFGLQCFSTCLFYGFTRASDDVLYDLLHRGHIRQGVGRVPPVEMVPLVQRISFITGELQTFRSR